MVGVPDPVMGEKVGAVVLPQPGVHAEDLVSSLIAYAREQLADFKVPQFARARRAAAAERRRQGAQDPLRQATEWIAVPR